jgi:hypothetical protein
MSLCAVSIEGLQLTSRQLSSLPLVWFSQGLSTSFPWDLHSLPRVLGVFPPASRMTAGGPMVGSYGET